VYFTVFTRRVLPDYVLVDYVLPDYVLLSDYMLPDYVLLDYDGWRLMYWLIRIASHKYFLSYLRVLTHYGVPVFVLYLTRPSSPSHLT